MLSALTMLVNFLRVSWRISLMKTARFGGRSINIIVFTKYEFSGPTATPDGDCEAVP
jgi:hypothetical protein